uniref:Reverse transcriptase Ty1/copia-type domain-containing protein n=1 Tax=Cajanus cajan TaxID=3821 RepID=A0A151TBY7_CAJCA|nr:hypothetical protein KK1_019143 [Cajanus cajan]
MLHQHFKLKDLGDLKFLLGLELSKSKSGIFMCVYRRLIGRLLYLTISRPDISYTSHKLGQFIFDPHSGHMDAAHMLLRYLKHTVGRGILFKTNSDTKLHAYLDADWGSYIDSRRSTTGFCVFLGNSLVSWKAKRHNTVSKSSAKVEYRSLASVSTELT